MTDNVNMMAAVTDKHCDSLRFPSDFADLHISENISPIQPIGQQQKALANMLCSMKSGTSYVTPLEILLIC